MFEIARRARRRRIPVAAFVRKDGAVYESMVKASGAKVHGRRSGASRKRFTVYNPLRHAQRAWRPLRPHIETPAKTDRRAKRAGRVLQIDAQASIHQFTKSRERQE